MKISKLNAYGLAALGVWTTFLRFTLGTHIRLYKEGHSPWGMSFETVKIEDEEDMYMLTFYMDGSKDRRGAYKRCMSILSPSSISKGKPSGKAKGKSSNSKRIPSGKAKRNTETQLLYEPFSTDQQRPQPCNTRLLEAVLDGIVGIAQGEDDDTSSIG